MAPPRLSRVSSVCTYQPALRPSSVADPFRAGVLTGSPIQAETRKRVVGVAASNPSRR